MVKSVYLVITDCEVILGCYRKEEDAVKHADFNNSRPSVVGNALVMPYEIRGKFDANIHF